MYSTKIMSLLFCFELLLISVIHANVDQQNELSNSTTNAAVAEERRDGHVKKHPRKRGIVILVKFALHNFSFKLRNLHTSRLFMISRFFFS